LLADLVIFWPPGPMNFKNSGTRREPPTMGKKLVNFITCGCESSTPFL
jgi:hypothetical protein